MSQMKMKMKKKKKMMKMMMTEEDHSYDDQELDGARPMARLLSLNNFQMVSQRGKSFKDQPILRDCLRASI